MLPYADLSVGGGRVFGWVGRQWPGGGYSFRPSPLLREYLEQDGACHGQVDAYHPFEQQQIGFDLGENHCAHWDFSSLCCVNCSITRVHSSVGAGVAADIHAVPPVSASGSGGGDLWGRGRGGEERATGPGSGTLRASYT